MRLVKDFNYVLRQLNIPHMVVLDDDLKTIWLVNGSRIWIYYIHQDTDNMSIGIFWYKYLDLMEVIHAVYKRV